MDQPELYRAFVNAILRLTFHNEKSVTAEFLKDNLFGEANVTLEGIRESISQVQKILRDAAQDDIELDELEQRLDKENLSETQQQVLLRAWKLNRQKVHEIIRQSTQWNDSLKSFNWRVDMKTKVKTDPKQDLNVPTAIMEFVVGNPNEVLKNGDDVTTDKVVRFELDKTQLASMIYEINQIESQIQTLVSEE